MRRPTSAGARIAAAAAAGGVPALVVLAWFTLRQSTGFLAHQSRGEFYEVQARAWLDGRWNVPPDAIGAERFNIDGRFYEYFGPFPALLRLPAVALTDTLDGRLARVCTWLGCALLLAAVGWLLWLTRRAFGRDADPTRTEVVAVAGFVFVAGCGSVVVFLAGYPAVFHEAIVWGVAWALVSSALLVLHLLDGRWLHLALASAAAACSILSRGSVGIGPVVALGLVVSWRTVEAVLARAVPWRSLATGVAATVVPLALFGWINHIKFGSAFGLPPIEKQDLLANWTGRAPALAANDGSLFGPDYAPTILLQYLRPDAITFDRLFPWVAFSDPPRVVGGAVFEALNPSVSVTASSILLVGLAALGLVALVRRRAAMLWAPMLGALVGSVGAVSLAFVDQRYQGDFLPLLLVPAALGLWVAVAAMESWPPTRRRVLKGALVALGIWSCWVNGGITYLYQHAYEPDATHELRAELVSTQLTIHDLLRDGPPRGVEQGPGPVEERPPGSLYVMGACRAVLWSAGSGGYRWVERTPSTGEIALQVRPTQDGRWPIVSSSDGTNTSIISGLVDSDRVRMEYDFWPEGSTEPTTVVGDWATLPDSGVRVDVLLDQQNVWIGQLVSVIRVEVDGKVVLEEDALVALGEPLLGEQTHSPAAPLRLVGSVDALPQPTPICDELVDLGAARR